MISDTNAAMVRLCGRMKLLTRIMQFGLVLGLLSLAFTAVASPAQFSGLTAAALELPDVPALTPVTGSALLALVALLTGLGLFGLQTVWMIFHRLQKANPFSLKVATLLRRAGVIALSGTVALLVARPLAMVLATLANPPGERIIAIGIDSDQVILLMVAGLLFAMGHVMVLATGVNDEYRRFV